MLNYLDYCKGDISMQSFLYKEFDDYAALWEDINSNSTSSSTMLDPITVAEDDLPARTPPVNFSLQQQKSSLPAVELSTFTKQKFLNSTVTSVIVAGMLGIVDCIWPGIGTGLSLVVKSGAVLAVSSVVAKVLETAMYTNLTRGFSGVKQLAEKNPNLKKEIYRLALEVGKKDAAKAIDSLEAYIADHPEVLDAETAEAMLELLYDPVEYKKVINLALVKTQVAAAEANDATLAEAIQMGEDASEETEEFIAELLADPILAHEVQSEG
jgi:hypothetical protein